jgi:hypothetical protein
MRDRDKERGLGLEVGDGGVSLKQIAVVLGLVFAVALAVVVGKQMSAEAMAVVVGVVCGVAAGIPTSVLLLVVLTRRDRQRTEELERRGGQHSYPPVVVIQGGSPQALPPGSQGAYWPAPQPGPASQRQFHVVGGDELLLDDGQYWKP